MREEPRHAGLIACATVSAIIVPVLAVSMLMAATVGTAHIAEVFILIPAVGGPIAAVHVILLWLPAYFFVTQDRELSWTGAAALGLVCGALPAFLLSETDPGATALFGGSGLVGGLSFRATFGLSRM